MYELLANQLQLQIISSDSPYDFGSFLFYYIGNDNLNGIQKLILRIMYTYPDIAIQMPSFEDKRRLKLPKFNGLDPYQAHIKSAASFLLENVLQPKIFSICNLISQYTPSTTIQAENTIENSIDYSEGRFWLNPVVRDFKGLKRQVSHNQIPANAPMLSSYLTAKEVTFLVGTPLHCIDLRKFIDLKNLTGRKLESVDSTFPIDVLKHPSSQSYIARVSVSRLEQDLKDFAHDENAALTPVMKYINTTCTFDQESISKALTQISTLVASLNTVRSNDNIAIKQGIEELLVYTNGVTAAEAGNAKAIRHNLLQRSKLETTLVCIICVYVMYVLYAVCCVCMCILSIYVMQMVEGAFSQHLAVRPYASQL